MNAQEAYNIYKSVLMKDIDPFLDKVVYPAIEKAARSGKRHVRISPVNFFNSLSRESHTHYGPYGMSEKENSIGSLIITVLEENGYKINSIYQDRSLEFDIFW